MRRSEIKDWLVMAGVCLALAAVTPLAQFAMLHARATLAIVFAVGAFWFFNKR